MESRPGHVFSTLAVKVNANVVITNQIQDKVDFYWSLYHYGNDRTMHVSKINSPKKIVIAVLVFRSDSL